MITRGVGVVDNDEPSDEDADGNAETLKEVMQSKGLAGVFDHNFLDPDDARKSMTVLEMEERAKKVAREAMNALRTSISAGGAALGARSGGTVPIEFEETAEPSSNALLSNLRQRNACVASNGLLAPLDESSRSYANLLTRIEHYVQRHRPSTEEILMNFKSEPNIDAAVFKRLLKSVAEVVDGRWVTLHHK
jgi:hypothetical protein